MSRQKYQNFDTSDGKSPESQPDNFGRANVKRLINTDRVGNASNEITHPAHGDSDLWTNDDRDLSINMGAIHIERGLEVYHAEMQRSNNEVAPHRLSRFGTSGATDLSNYETV